MNNAISTNIFTQVSAKRIVGGILLLLACMFILNYASYLTIYKGRFVNYLLLRGVETDVIDAQIAERAYQLKDFLSIAGMFLLTILSVSVVMYLGLYVINNIKRRFAIVLQVVVISMSVFVAEYLAEFLWLYLVKPDYTSIELMGFTLFSALQLFDINTTPSYLLYALQTINLWELLFCLTLAYGLSRSTGIKYSIMLKSTSIIYGGALLLWILLIMSLNLFLN
ncbi:MAG: hypothetical protein LBG19_12565 [Prevotellaceae bacterium]|jgi:hypothetical protein|nr:hypothetical protein [Prevotellaceae bacterium]